MAQPYLEQLSLLISQPVFASRDLTCKHFFSGAALYFGGKICASLTPKGLAFKLSPPRCDEILTRGGEWADAVPLRYFESSPVKRGYILLPNYQDIDVTTLIEYFEECFAYAGAASLPPRPR